MESLNICVSKTYDAETYTAYYKDVDKSWFILKYCLGKFLVVLCALGLLSYSATIVILERTLAGFVFVVIALFLFAVLSIDEIIRRTKYEIEQHRLTKLFCLRECCTEIKLTGILHLYKRSILTLRDSLSGDVYSFELDGYVRPRDCCRGIEISLTSITLKGNEDEILTYKYK